jgi:hypothetical protein
MGAVPDRKPIKLTLKRAIAPIRLPPRAQPKTQSLRFLTFITLLLLFHGPMPLHRRRWQDYSAIEVDGRDYWAGKSIVRETVLKK